LALLNEAKPAPAAIPVGVVMAKKDAIRAAERFLNCACWTISW
jgi:hypothetical protein